MSYLISSRAIASHILMLRVTRSGGPEPPAGSEIFTNTTGSVTSFPFILNICYKILFRASHTCKLLLSFQIFLQIRDNEGI
jgi:hypothetical protein